MVWNKKYYYKGKRMKKETDMIEFTHFGKIGDLLYSLYFCNEFTHFIGEEKFDFFIQTNVRYTPSELVKNSIEEVIPVLLSRKSAQSLIPFLKAQPYINQVRIGDILTNSNDIILNAYIYKDNINTFCGDCRDWYYICSNVILPREFWKPIFFVNPDYRFKDKIIFTLTQRYINCRIDYNQLKQFKDEMIFLGTEKEYQVFSRKYFKMEYAGKFNNMLEIAQVMRGAKGYISNQNGLFAIAEGLKIPRCVIAPDFLLINNEEIRGPVNISPLGGISNVAHDTEGLLNTINVMKTISII